MVFDEMTDRVVFWMLFCELQLGYDGYVMGFILVAIE